jgi:hypothetical protein
VERATLAPCHCSLYAYDSRAIMLPSCLPVDTVLAQNQ